MTYHIKSGSLGPLKINETDTVASVLQNVAIILNTFEGTVPLYRDFGVSAEYLHKPNLAAIALLRVEIKEKVERYEPRVSVVGVTFDEKENGLTISLEVELLE